MQAVVKRWGNSYAIRLTKRDLADLRLREGDEVDVQVQRRLKIDLSGLPQLDDEPDAGRDHDRYLYG